MIYSFTGRQPSTPRNGKQLSRYSGTNVYSPITLFPTLAYRKLSAIPYSVPNDTPPLSSHRYPSPDIHHTSACSIRHPASSSRRSTSVPKRSSRIRHLQPGPFHDLPTPTPAARLHAFSRQHDPPDDDRQPPFAIRHRYSPSASPTDIRRSPIRHSPRFRLSSSHANDITQPDCRIRHRLCLLI
jgi:hypothetical protein